MLTELTVAPGNANSHEVMKAEQQQVDDLAGGRRHCLRVPYRSAEPKPEQERDLESLGEEGANPPRTETHNAPVVLGEQANALPVAAAIAFTIVDGYRRMLRLLLTLLTIHSDLHGFWQAHGPSTMQVRDEQAENIEEKQRKWLHEYLKKFIASVVMMMMNTPSIYKHARGRNAWACYASFIFLTVAFFTSLVSMTLLLKSNIRFIWHHVLVLISSTSLVLMAYFLLLSIDNYYWYAILAVAPLVAYFLRQMMRFRGTEANASEEELDHIFNIAGGLIIANAIAAINGNIFGHSVRSKETVVVDALGFFLFFDIVVALWLMVITTVRLQMLTVHAKRLHSLLLLLLDVSAFTAAIEFPNGTATFIVVIIAEAFVFAVCTLVCSVATAGSSGSGDTSRQRWRDDELLWTILAGVIFTALVQLRSCAKDDDDAVKILEMVCMLLYFTAFLCSVNPVLFHHEAPGRGCSCRVLLEWARSAVVLIASVAAGIQLMGGYEFFVKKS